MTMPPPPPVAPLDQNLPLVLLPVRLETRFRAASGGTDLLIRVYPDDVHVDTHEPELTADESTWGRTYWDKVWRCGRPPQVTDTTREQAVWAQLAGRFGPERAAWIARALEPTNIGSRPATAVAETAAVPAPKPIFPTPAARSSAWTRAPRAALLPDRWIVLGYGPSGGRVLTAVGNPIPDPLPVGPLPDPNPLPPAGTSTTDGTLLIDDGMRWLVDFNRAVEVGMAIQVRVTTDLLVGGMARLVVVGIKASLDPQLAAQRLGALLDAQHFTRGLACVPPGTPTNNTPEVSSGLTGSDPGHRQSFLSERNAPVFQPGGGANGDAAASALGVPASVFTHVAHAGDDDQVLARHLNAALWPATWGYYLEQRLFGAVDDATLDRIRRHFVSFVRADGPLPALRLGKQPYGLLPATSLDRWKPRDANEPGDRATYVLRQLREAYRRAVVRVPRMGTVDPDQDIMAVLRMQAISTRWDLRHTLGPQYFDNFWNFADALIDQTWWNAQQQMTNLFPGLSLPLPQVTPQSSSVYLPWTVPMNEALVGATTNYLAALAPMGHQQLRIGLSSVAEPQPLLYRLARHALLTEYGWTARRALQNAGILAAADRLEPELIDIVPQPSQTIWRHLDKPLQILGSGPTLGQFLDNPANETLPECAGLGSVRAALRYLGQRDAASLERALPGALDLASHRLDAWVTSLATSRLASLRTTRPDAAYVGGFGWVEDLRPGSARGSDGYIHAPSMAQGTAAAVLASAYLSHQNDGQASPFAIDLSSERVRTARWLIDGVRQGQPLAALLGYRLERSLHERALDPYIDKFRKLAPLVPSPSTPTIPTEAIAACNVVHGLEILSLWKNKDPRFQALRTSVNIADFITIDSVFAALDDQRDALGDLLVAESVYQATHGNMERAGVTLDSVVRGEMLPDPEIVDTPRTGLGMNHRLVVLFKGATVAIPNWRAQLRTSAEPHLSLFAAQILGNPINVRCRATYVDPLTGATLKAPEIRLVDLLVAPLDVVYFAPGELELRFILACRRTPPAGVPANADVRLDFSRASTWASSIFSVDEFLEAVAAVRRLITHGRPLNADDLTLPELGSAPGIDLVELKGRADVVVTAVRRLQTDLQAWLAVTAPDFNAGRDALLRAAHIGISRAVPTAAPTATPAELSSLRGQVGDTLIEIGRRLAAAGNVVATPGQPDGDLERLRAVLGRDFVVLPRFKVANTTELSSAFGASTTLQANDPLAANTWLTRMAFVREGAARLNDTLRFSEAVTAASPPLAVAQLPFVAGERWVALPPAPGQAIPPGRQSIVACAPAPIDPTQPLAGVLIDDWSEVVPSKAEATGLAFNYDAPGSRPPQTILLAVAPDMGQPWNLDTIEAILLETLELAKLRMVDPDAMQELDQYLPALYFALNAAGDTVSTRLID